MKLIFQWLFDRPMTYLECCFIDSVVCREVNLYKGKDGRLWMAHSAWSWFRVEVKGPTP